MNIGKICRLCCDLSPDCSHALYDASGGCTEVYGITVKYFDPMLLVMDHTNNHTIQSTIICQECWNHIREFHEFQQNVLLSQSKLLADFKPHVEDVKEEAAYIFDDSRNGSEISRVSGSRVEDNGPNYIKSKEVAGDKNEDQLISECKGYNLLAPLDVNKHIGEILDEVKEECELIENNDVIYDSTDDNYRKDLINDNLSDEILYSSDDVPIGQIIANKNRSGSKKNMRRSRKQKQAVTRSRIENNSKGSIGESKDKSKNRAHNSAERIQELDKFIADVKPQLECDLCKCFFPNYNSLRSHFTDAHQAKCYVVCCDKKIFRRYLLVEHLRLHVNPETYKCDICGSISASSRTLIAHKRFMHHTTKSLECEICNRKFKGKPTLIRHMATHATGSKDLKCSQCDRYFAFDFQLKLHINNVHNEIKICDQCGKTLHGAAALKHHLLQHSEIKQTKWPCDQCDAQLASLWGLKSHKLSFHPDGKTAFICKECGKVASSEITLRRHKRLVHQMERKYKCTYCEKNFKKNSHLKDHIAIHTGQHIHQCSLCSQTFINSGSLHKHRKKVHPIEWNEARQHRIDLPKVNTDFVIREVLL